MSTEKQDLPRAFLGFDTAAVSQALERQAGEHTAELQALHEELLAERTRQERLQAQVVRTEEQVRAQRALALELEAALALSGRTAGILQDAVHNQLGILEAEAAERRHNLEGQIAELAERVRHGIRLVDQAAEQVGAMAGASSHPPVAPPVSVSAPAFRPEPAPVAGRILPFRTAAQAESLPTPPAPDPTPAPALEPQPQVEAGIRNRMAASMSRMLEGKVVGQTLTDPQGAVIAQKGAPITADLAARAESAGVLADLILHMVWPEEAQS